MSIHDSKQEIYDKLANEMDWQDGMNVFRSKISKEITEIYQSIARIESHILKLRKKETTP